MAVFKTSERETATGGIIGETLRSSGKYLILDVVIKNNLNEQIKISQSHLFLIDGKGRKYSVDTKAHQYVNVYNMNNYYAVYEKLNPGLIKDVGIIFDVPYDLDINEARL